MPPIPVISNLTLHGLPQLIRRELGARALARVVRDAGLDLEAVEGESCFIPQAAALRLIEMAARIAGEANFGLLMAPQMDVANYGAYGRYIHGADSLGGAIGRAIEALGFHSNGDAMALDLRGAEARFRYGLALAGHAGHHHVANVAAGALASVCRRFLPADWRPLRIELDMPRPRRPDPFEEMFRCPVVFDAPVVTVAFERDRLEARRPASAAAPIITLADLARDRRGAAPRDTLGIVSEHIRLQIRGGAISIDSTARAMDTSIRSLQRRLNREGADFRSLANAARAGRALELLRQSDASIARIAAELGYSTPANFSRALRAATGRSAGALRAAEGGRSPLRPDAP